MWNVYGLALSIIRDRRAAEEFAQDTFVRAWRYAASFDPRRGSAAAWLLVIARNTSLDYIRARGRRLERLPFDSLDALIESADEPGEHPHEAIAPVADAVRSLPVEQRDTLMAAAYYGFTAREISEAWNVPVGTVKTRLRLALHKVRDGLTEVPAMTAMDCADLADAAPELALGVLYGRERAEALAHLDGCGVCRQLVSSLSCATDELLRVLAPSVQPPAGFEDRVLEALAPTAGVAPPST